MAFVIASHAEDIASAKRQALVVKAAVYRHDVAWSLHSDFAGVGIWAKAFAKTCGFEVFYSNAEKLPGPAFSGPHGGFNAGLLLGFLHDAGVVCLRHDVVLHEAALDGLAGTHAGALLGACHGFCQHPVAARTKIQEVLHSVKAGVVSKAFASKQLADVVSGKWDSDEFHPCFDSLFVSPHAAGSCPIPPWSVEPFLLYSQVAYRFGVHVGQADRPWTRHEQNVSTPLNVLWRDYHATQALAGVIQYVLDKTSFRTVSDYLLDEAATSVLWDDEPFLTSNLLAAVSAVDEPLAKSLDALSRPVPIHAKNLKVPAKLFLEAQTSWEKTLQHAGQTGLVESLRL
ncbi:hypothetical protein HY572_00610 [Candidatus Micrarchaeota archaeon]|nr:hypothetical protein [Candidatus Micrarchaeota archaeon]